MTCVRAVSGGTDGPACQILARFRVPSAWRLGRGFGVRRRDNGPVARWRRQCAQQPTDTVVSDADRVKELLDSLECVCVARPRARRLGDGREGYVGAFHGLAGLVVGHAWAQQLNHRAGLERQAPGLGGSGRRLVRGCQAGVDCGDDGLVGFGRTRVRGGQPGPLNAAEPWSARDLCGFVRSGVRSGWGSVVTLVAGVVGSNGGATADRQLWEGPRRQHRDQDMSRLGSLTVGDRGRAEFRRRSGTIWHAHGPCLQTVRLAVVVALALGLRMRGVASADLVRSGRVAHLWPNGPPAYANLWFEIRAAWADARRKEDRKAMEWTSDVEFILDDTIFRASPWSGFHSTSDHFLLAKERELVEYYRGLITELCPRTIVELGIHQGGSIAFFAALAKPRRMVGIELEKNPAAALQEHIANRSLEGVVSAHYGVDQGDSGSVRRIVETAFVGDQIDLVVDDASHRLIPSRLSFNTLFPYVRPGGLYVIEDWALVHVGIPWGEPGDQPLSVLGFELLMAVGGRGGLIESVEIDQYVIAVKRGSAEIDPGTFDIGNCYNDESRKLVPGL